MSQKPNKAGLIRGQEDQIYVKQDLDRNWCILRTKANSDRATILFRFATSNQALQAAKKIAEAIGSQYYSSDPNR